VEGGAEGTLDISLRGVGAGGAMLLTRWLSVGGSLMWTHLTFESYATSLRGTPPNPPKNGTVTNARSNDAGVIAGVLVKPFRNVAIGSAYSSRGEFDFETAIFGMFSNGDQEHEVRNPVRPVRYVMPARYSLGGSWRASDAFTFVADMAHVTYSSRVSENERFLVVDFMGDTELGMSRANFFEKDVNEYHTGAEYRLLLRNSVVAFRGGLFTDPNHPLRFRKEGLDPRNGATILSDFRFNETPYKTDWGYTAGMGFTVWNNMQFDLAASYSHDSWETVFSIVHRLQ
jgi:long-subunit fatty acid transport protein